MLVRVSFKSIRDTLETTRDRIRGALALEILNTNGASMPRSGRPILYSDRDRR